MIDLVLGEEGGRSVDEKVGGYRQKNGDGRERGRRKKRV